MDEFEEVKRRIEAEDGKPLEPSDEIVCRAVHGFIRGVQLRNELESQPTSEPVHIRDILPGVMAGIEARRQGHRRSVMQATMDFLAGKSKRAKGPIRNRSGQPSNLWQGSRNEHSNS